MSKPLAPRMRQIPARKSALLSVLDVGASKIVCLIARLTPMEPSEALRGRTHRCKVLGIGHQRSNGVKGGAVVDLHAAEHAVRLAVDAAERMAGVEWLRHPSLLPRGPIVPAPHVLGKTTQAGRRSPGVVVVVVEEASQSTPRKVGKGAKRRWPRLTIF